MTALLPVQAVVITAVSAAEHLLSKLLGSQQEKTGLEIKSFQLLKLQSLSELLVEHVSWLQAPLIVHLAILQKPTIKTKFCCHGQPPRVFKQSYPVQSDASTALCRWFAAWLPMREIGMQSSLVM